jgi:hypothetical protein
VPDKQGADDHSVNDHSFDDQEPERLKVDHRFSDKRTPDHCRLDDQAASNDPPHHCAIHHVTPDNHASTGVDMSNDNDGLSTPAQVEALADQLSASADALHMRLRAEAGLIGALPGRSAARARRQAAADRLQDAEQALRQHANSLYADAATLIVSGLGKPQQHVIALTQAAAEHIRKIALLADATGLVAGLLVLAGGVASAQPAAVLAALETIRTQLKAVKVNLPAKPH